MIPIRVLVLITIVCAMSAGLVAGARAIGQTTTPPPTFLETGGCEQPCWQGIKPGKARREQFFYALDDYSPYGGHVSDQGDEIITMMELSIYGALTVADVMREFGPPERVGCIGLDRTTLYPGGDWVTSVQLYFAGGLIAVNALRPGDVLRLTPDMRVRSIRYYAPGDPAYPIGQTTGWFGFASSPAPYLACHR
ncbi:MAG: hypothetical protein JW966_05865 [Anaerolineae bacterium]|nr:hypothetical protein [Anaerolineae bacterium]